MEQWMPDRFLSIDGVDSGASASKSGGVTTITAANSGMWSPGQVVSATLTYSAGGSSRSVSWSWTVTNYATLSQGLTPVGSGSDAGFEFRIYQTAAGVETTPTLQSLNWQVYTPMVLKTSPILPVVLFPTTMHVLESSSMWMV